MKCQRLFWLGAAMAILSLPATAEYRVTVTGNDLLTLCRGINIETMKASPTAEMRCLQYINGVMDLWGKLRTFRAVKSDAFDLDFCLPVGGIRGDVAVTVVADYLEKRDATKRRADAGAAFVIPALSEAFPCR